MHPTSFLFITNSFSDRGVLQSLVEKHFPAPDRNRIHRLLGIDTKKMKQEQNGNVNNEASSSSGKRKSGKYPTNLPSRR